jgi:hypothetical protein
MSRSLQFTINGEQFWIDEFDDGFAWKSNRSEGDCFPTQAEAQQDAMRHVRERDAQERKADEDDSYHNEVSKFFNYRDYP